MINTIFLIYLDLPEFFLYIDSELDRGSNFLGLTQPDPQVN